MTPDHPKWREFCKELSHQLYMDFVHAQKLLPNGCSVSESILFFEDHGALCDAEILMNVVSSEPDKHAA
jgi:hypothetical protein